MGFAEGAQPALDQGRVGQHPAVQGGVVDLEAALEEQLFDVTVAERIAQVPRDGLQDQRRFVVTAFEIVLSPQGNEFRLTDLDGGGCRWRFWMCSEDLDPQRLCDPA